MDTSLTLPQQDHTLPTRKEKTRKEQTPPPIIMSDNNLNECHQIVENTVTISI